MKITQGTTAFDGFACLRRASSEVVLRGDDGEGGVGGVEQSHELAQRRGIAGVLDPVQAVPGQQAEELRLGQGEREVRGRLGAGVLGLDERAVG